MPVRWMVEEEEALAQLEREIEAARGAHRAHCPQCVPLPSNPNGRCAIEVWLRMAAQSVTGSRVLCQQRQDEMSTSPGSAR